MAQYVSAIASTQRCCVAIDISSEQLGYIATALGIALLVSGIFVILATYNMLTNEMNAIINELGVGGPILGYGTIIAGSFLTTYGLWNVLSGWNDWKRGPGKNEVEQTFEAFETSEGKKTNAKRDVLNIVIIDEEMSKDEREILQIVSSYLKVIHGVTVTLKTNYTLKNERRREKQYAAEPYISQLKEGLPETAFVIGFTNKDLYPDQYSNTTNFIFGVGLWKYAAGLFSTYRLNNGDFGTTLIRLMRLASHEFGHMRGLEHCTKYACCMQGVNSMHEADRVPLTFCALDMAKICCLNGWSLKKGYQGQLDFFKGFNEKYGKKVDFSREIKTLTETIKNLESH